MKRGNAGTLLILAVSLVLAGTACLFSPDSTDGGNDEYYSPADSAWKVLYNFQLAYQTRNLNAYLDCLDEEFEFILLETDWDDYDGDGIVDESWGKDKEEEFTTNMCSSSQAEYVELILTGNTETVWYGDPSGETKQLVRAFDLKVYYYDDDNVQQGWRAQGDAIFRCRPDENEEYRIWQWEDQSET